MIVFFIKFIHLVAVLGLLSTVIYCLCTIGSTQLATDTLRKNLFFFHKTILLLSLIALLTGTLLVHPKHFTFDTPWIQAAYYLIAFFALSVFVMNYIKKQRLLYQSQKNISRKERFIWQVAYVALTIILLGITHDAVTKSTFLF